MWKTWRLTRGDYIIMPSIKTMKKLQTMSRSTLLMKHWKTAGVQESPYGITQYSLWPEVVPEAVFHLSPSLIWMRLKALRRSILWRCLCYKVVTVLRGLGQKIVIFDWFKSLQSLSLLSFFLKKRKCCRAGWSDIPFWELSKCIHL